MIRELKTPSFSQLFKRINRLDVDIDQNKMIIVSNKGSRVMAVDESGLKVTEGNGLGQNAKSAIL